ncbi:MAG: metal ABC transporter ATP-binding protein [Candidatus Bathyarchaeia archaeon]
MEPFIEFIDVNLEFNGKPILSGISFKVWKPELVLILGPNGAGKTTLLRLIIGILKPSSGFVRVLGRDPHRDRSTRRLIGYVPQRERIDPSMPMLVKDVILMGRLLSKSLPRIVTYRDEEEALSIASKLGIEDLWHESYSHLSGGEQQRVLIARALASDPKILLLDEPFSAIDTSSMKHIVDIVYEEYRRGVCMMVVLHDATPLIDHATKILLLNKRLIAFGDPDTTLREDLLRETYMRTVHFYVRDGTRFIGGVDSHA